MSTTVERGTVDAITLAAIDAAYEAASIPDALREITKGGRLPVDDASGSTHLGDGVADLRTRTLTRAQYLEVVEQLRRRNFAAWYRDQAQGFSPHIHAVRMECSTLSTSARRQAIAYKAGRDGLDAGGPDYHHRPAQHPYPLEEDLMPTAEEIATAVWAMKDTDPVTGDTVSMRTILMRTRVTSKQSAVSGDDPNPEAVATVALIASQLGA